MKKLFFTFLLALVVGISAKAETVTVTYDNSQSSDYSYHGTLSDGVTEIYFYQSSQYDYDLDQYVNYWCVTKIGTPNSSITIPDSVSYNGTVYPVKQFGYSSNDIDVTAASNLIEIHLPSTITNCDGRLPYQILSLYLTSPQVISFYDYFFWNMNSALNIVVSESFYSTYYSNFQNSSSYLRNAAGNLTYERVASNFYTITVNTPGTLAQEYFNVATNWADVDELTVIGSIDESDMKLFSRMTNLSKLDLQQTTITTIKGCSGLKRLKTVLLPSTVTSVSDSAFMNCRNLDSLVIPASITSIGNYSFYNCARLKSIPTQNVQSIGSYALYGCSSLQSLSLQNVRTLSSDALSGTNLSYGTLTLPELTSMGSDAFGSISANTLILPKMVDVPDYAFSELQIQYFVLPIAKTIGKSAFAYGSYNDSLLSIDMPLVESIGNSAFSRCRALTSVNMPKVTTIGNGAFYYCYSLTSVNMPSVQYIYDGAFCVCPIDTLILPASIRQMGSSPFSTNNLTHVFCYAPIPIVTDAFSVSINAILHVPAFSLSSYRMHDSWSTFPTIVPIDTLCDNLLITKDYVLNTVRGLVAKPSIYVQNYSGSLTINTDTVVSLNNFYQSFDSPQFAKYRDGRYNYNYNNGYTQYYDIEGSCSPAIISDTVTADYVYQDVFMRPGYWNFVSFPFDVDVDDIIVPDNTNWVVRRYSGADRAALTGNSWQNMTEGMTLNANEGYIIHCQPANSSSSYYDYDDYLTFRFIAKQNANKNKIFANGDVTVPLDKYAAEKPHNANWNMVGNPYPCFFNSSAIQHNGIITVWNGDGYTAYSLLDDSYTLLPGEAFFVQCPNDASSMTFLASGRSLRYTTPEISYAPANFLSSDDNVRKVYNLILSNDTLSDRTRFVINPSASVEYELSCDASKFAGNSTAAPDFYMVENEEHLAINERPMASGVFSLGFNAKVAGNYTITLESNPDATTRPYITDKQTGEKKCLENAPYTFYTAIGTFDERFIITFDEVPTGIDNADSDHESDFIENGDVYAMDGRFVMHFENRMELENLSTGTYVLRSNANTEKFIKK